MTTLDELKAAAEQERLRTLAGLGARSETKILEALAQAPPDPRESRRLLGDGLPAVLAVVAVLREHPAAVKVSEAGSVRRRRETFRDLDIIATSTDAPALIDYFTTLNWVAEVVAKGDTKATVISNDGLRFDLRVVPPESYGNLLQHFTGSKDHNVALREDAVRRGLLGLRVRRHDRRDRRGRHGRGRGGPVRAPRLRLHPARAARERGRARGRARRARCPSSSSAATCGATCIALDLVGREGLPRGDGDPGARAGARVPRDVRPRAAASATGKLQSAVGGDRPGQRAPGAVPRAQGDRGQHPRERRARRRRRAARAARLGDGLACTRASTRTRPAACCGRWRARTWTASAT